MDAASHSYDCDGIANLIHNYSQDGRPSTHCVYDPGGQSQTTEHLESGESYALIFGYAAMSGGVQAWSVWRQTHKTFFKKDTMETEWNISNCCLVDIRDFLECAHFMGHKVLVDRVKMLGILTSKESEISNLELRIQHLEKIFHIERRSDDGTAMMESEPETEGSHITDQEQNDVESLSDFSDDEADSFAH